VNTGTSLQHCGDCNQPCGLGQQCSGGSCQSAVGADGCDGAAKDLTVDQIAVYQSLKIPIMTGGQAVATGARPAAIVEGRETLVRIFVRLEAGFAARELSARLLVLNGTTRDEYFAKRSVSASSNESDLNTTFQIFVPGAKVTADTRYAVEVVECGASNGTVRAPRFPALGEAALGARRTGALKVRLVPIVSNTRAPDTSAGALAVYRDYLAAMYPAGSVELSVVSSVDSGYPLNWSSMLDQIRAKRQSESPPNDVYYYGLVKPTDTFAQYCNGSCTAGIGYVTGASTASYRAAVGIAWADTRSASTMAHELGHNHGRNHAPCAPGSISGVDGNYPHSGGLIGTWGYDPQRRVLLDPSRTTDIMGYCSSKWVSDYTYRALTDRVATLNGALDTYVGRERIGLWRVLLLDATGPRWGVPFTRPDVAYGEPELVEILDAGGQAIASVTAYRTEVADMVAATLLVPEPLAGWYAVRPTGWPSLRFSAPVSVPGP
jgi:hypothetical protein